METNESVQYILDENGELCEMLKADAIPVEYPVKYKIKNAFEVFVRVKNTENYWISNYGRCINNLNRKDKNKFYIHKTGKCHYTVFEIKKYIISYSTKKQKNGKRKADMTTYRTERTFDTLVSDMECNSIIAELKNANDKREYVLDSCRKKRETSPKELVAETFLKKYENRSKIWHKDGDETNNWYKNLLYVSQQDYADLKTGKVTWQELNLEQEYIEYENRATFTAYKTYSSIKKRCGDTKEDDRIGKCYDDAKMCQEWIDNPKAFVKWYLQHYYEVDNESMAVDKDLFGKDAKVYSPENCCILPQGLNTLLSNSKKHYFEGENPNNTLPLGIRYNRRNKKYYGMIMLTGSGDKSIALSEWDTAEEAFAEYKLVKEADFILTAAQYKNKIPEYIYKELIKVEIKPY